jgi:hypothetical protein
MGAEAAESTEEIARAQHLSGYRNRPDKQARKPLSDEIRLRARLRRREPRPDFRVCPVL